MDCIICGLKTNNKYNENYICENCITESNSIEKKYENTYVAIYEEPTKILENLYIGNINSTIDDQELKKLGINQIITVGTGNNKYIKNAHNLNMLELFVNDSLEQKLDPFIDIAINNIESNINMKTLVHCYSGISRSAAFVIAYLMKKNKISYEEAFKFLKTKYPKANPNSNFVNQLKLLSNGVNNNNNLIITKL